MTFQSAGVTLKIRSWSPKSNQLLTLSWEHNGSVVECLAGDRGAADSSLTGVTALCPSVRHINPSIVLVQDC